MLSFNDYKNTVHNRETLYEYKKTLVHEIVHGIHINYCSGNYPIDPIWVGLAVYLSKQYEVKNGELTANKEELLNGNCDFIEYYFFFKKLLENYSKKTILEILKNKINGYEILEEILKKLHSPF